jgi:radical SAM superfamily enzyme YgiQ (UPF0313 family)
MRVLLISTNRESKPSFAIPRGLAFLSGALEKAGHSGSILDLCFETDEVLVTIVENGIKSFEPEMIGISIRNVDNESLLRYRRSIDDVALVIDTCRRHSNAPLVLGGPGFSLMPEEILRYVNVELGVVGEGEVAICRLADAFSQGKEPAEIPGLVTLREGRFQDASPARVLSFSSVSYSNSYAPDDRYFSTNVVGPQPVYGIQTKRGCAFRCAYCPVPSIEGRTFRLRDPEDVATEIFDARWRLGISRFFITDSIVNIPYRHAVAFCKAIIDKELDITWMAYATPLQFDSELAHLLADAGCSMLHFGIDAACPEMLRGWQKDFSVDDIIAATQHCKEAGIRVAHSLLLGGPNETIDTVRKTLAVVQQISPHLLTISFGARLYSQAPLWKYAARCFDLQDKSMLDPLFYVSQSIDANAERAIREMLETFIRENPQIVVKTNFSTELLGAHKATLIQDKEKVVE